MNMTLKFLSGLGIGAGLMYFFDPRSGTRRRKVVRDNAVRYTRDARDAIVDTSKDLSSRAQGLVTQVMRATRMTPAPSRVKSRRRA